MKFILSAALSTLVLTTQVAAHYRWTSLIVNGSATPAWKYVRENNSYNDPVTDVTSTDLRCNKGTRVSSTTTVAADSTVGFQLDQAVYHHGTLNVYLSKAPSTAATYDGSGPWFKIYQMAPVTDGGKTITFPTDNISSANFKIPANTPPGEYLLRIEHIALQDASYSGGAQFYISCAQIAISGAGGGTPGPLVSIPGAYKATDPGLLIDIYWPIPATYAQPGPVVWSG